MASRFAENQSLYRLSGNKDGSGKGHGGVMCEGCHGSTHAIWPNQNPFANDNITATRYRVILALLRSVIPVMLLVL